MTPPTNPDEDSPDTDQTIHTLDPTQLYDGECRDCGDVAIRFLYPDAAHARVPLFVPDEELRPVTRFSDSLFGPLICTECGATATDITVPE